MLTGAEGRRVSVSVGAVGMVAGWVAVVVLLVWSVIVGDVLLSQWAAVGSAAAASWTMVVGCRWVMGRTAKCILSAIERLVQVERDLAVAAVADEVVRRLELRELEAQVAQLVPPLRRT